MLVDRDRQGGARNRWGRYLWGLCSRGCRIFAL